MAEILLTSENFVKSVTSISDNLAGKYLRPSIREAQDIGLRGILGDTLLEKLKTLVGSGDIAKEENLAYKNLLDRAQYYLAYNAVVEVAAKVSYKIVNFGVAKSQDENLQTASPEEISQMRFYYQSKADHCCIELQNYLLNNRNSYAELTEGDCNRIHSNLYSAASSGIWLGGPRAKSLPGTPVRNGRR